MNDVYATRFLQIINFVFFYAGEFFEKVIVRELLKIWLNLGSLMARFCGPQKSSLSRMRLAKKGDRGRI